MPGSSNLSGPLLPTTSNDLGWTIKRYDWYHSRAGEQDSLHPISNLANFVDKRARAESSVSHHFIWSEVSQNLTVLPRTEQTSSRSPRA